MLQQSVGSKMVEDLQIEKLRDKLFLEIIQGGSKLTATGTEQNCRAICRESKIEVTGLVSSRGPHMV